MSTQTLPQIPPRPSRHHAHEQSSTVSSGSTLGSEIPKIPPRPLHRRIDRSRSPNRDSFARSPLNEPTFVSQGGYGKSPLYSNESANASREFSSRPPSVVMPSLGQEGAEYAEAFAAPSDLSSSPNQTRNIANDLELQQPKPSLPATSAKRRVSVVTRTDSGQAAAAGIGKPQGDNNKTPLTRSLKSKSSSLSMNSANGTERPSSIISDSEHGIPEIGQRVPMYPDAGDVQAPSPSPYAQQFPTGIGFHNDGSKPHHARKASQKGFDGPPGSYGLHGHGQIHNDRFEKIYYEKHPELLKRETGHYGGALGDGPREWVMSSEDLNKIVRETASRGAGLGTSPAFVSTPTENYAYLASEEYVSRQASPRPQSIRHKKGDSNSSQTHPEPPSKQEVLADKPNDAASTAEPDADDAEVVHVELPERPSSRLHGNAGYVDTAERFAQDIAEFDEYGYSAPILAPDEVAKEPLVHELQPAVSPLNERRGSSYDFEPLHHFRTHSSSGSRPTSRPVSIHGSIPGVRLGSEYDAGHSTPLEDLTEYEPLFAEDNESNQKPITAADKLKARPELRNRKFPSQDVWEDTPASSMYTATVSTPQLPEDDNEEGDNMRNLHVREGETPEQAFARKQEELAEAESREATDSFLHPAKKPWSNQPQLTNETRPNLKYRFPSRDVWEDSPDSMMLTTTVSTPQQDEPEVSNQPEDRSTTGASVSHAEKDAAGNVVPNPKEDSPTTGAAVAKPQVPARPTKAKPVVRSEVPSTSASDIPVISERSKPSIPARPAKPATKNSSEHIPLSTVTSNSSVKSIESDVLSKPKPTVPSRPLGSKIAALQGGFLSDLNKRLQLGPQPPKKEDPAPEPQVEEKEKAPLSDARKGRARGPARRAPAKSSVPVESTPVAVSTLSFSIIPTSWQISPDDDLLDVVSSEIEEPVRETKAAQSSTPTLATNTAGEEVFEPSDIAPGAESSSSLPSSVQDKHAQEDEEARREALVTSEDSNSSSPIQISDSPPVTGPTETGSTPVDADEDLSESTGTIKASEIQTKDDVTQTGEQVIHTNTSDEEGIAENLVAYTGAQAPDEGNVVVKEPLEKGTESMPGSFE